MGLPPLVRVLIFGHHQFVGFFAIVFSLFLAARTNSMGELVTVRRHIFIIVAYLNNVHSEGSLMARVVAHGDKSLLMLFHNHLWHVRKGLCRYNNGGFTVRQVLLGSLLWQSLFCVGGGGFVTMVLWWFN